MPYQKVRKPPAEPKLLRCGHVGGHGHGRGCGGEFPQRFEGQKCGYCDQCLTRFKAERSRQRAPLAGDLRVVNCGRCRRLLVVPGQGWDGPEPEEAAGKCYGRWHCKRCLPHARREPLPPANSFSIPQTREG